MWAIRRTSRQLRNQGVPSRSGRIFSGKTELAKCSSETSKTAIIEHQTRKFDGFLSSTIFYSKASCFSESIRDVRTFSSQVGAKSNGEDLEDGFSELETSQDTVEVAASEDDVDLISGSELSEDEGSTDDVLNELKTCVSETDHVGKKPSAARDTSAMSKAILASRAVPVSKVLDKWVEEGNEVTEAEVALTMNNLRKRRLYVKALQLSEWLESSKHLEFTEPNYVSRVDLLAKVQGLYKAESYIKQIPESFRNEMVYRTLLANCASTTNVKKAEEVFNKMRGLGFPVTSFACNQLLLLYKRTDRKKIAHVLLLMEKENVKPTVLTYQILIEVKGQTGDISGMEQILDMMKAEELEPSSQIQTRTARYYALAGKKDKAEAVLKQMEGADLEMKNRWACCLLIPIYASLGRADEVERIWKVCESEPRLEECLAAIEAWGQLKEIEKAEAAFDKLLTKVKKPSPKHYSFLLKVYANHKMLGKGKDLVNQMAASGCIVGPVTWDAVVKLYVGAGEVEKADTILRKAIEKKTGKPLFTSFMAIMEKYANRGDVHNAEKLFQMMRDAGYTSRIRQYQTLLNAYVKAKKPAYGFRDRMKGDNNITPNRLLVGQLAKVDAFKKSPVDDLLE